jgi:hypothetical protein
MRWPWLSPTPGEVLGIAFGIAVAAAFIIGVIYFPWIGWNWRSNAGLGPDWVCNNLPGEQVCVKTVPAKSGNRNTP